MSIRKERGGSIQCHAMLSYGTTARMRAPVDFGKFARLPLRCGDGFVTDILAKKLPIARDAMDVGGGECSQNFLTSRSWNVLPPRISIFPYLLYSGAAAVVETAFGRRLIQALTVSSVQLRDPLLYTKPRLDT